MKSKGRLWKISVTISAEIETRITETLEFLFCQSPSVYIDAESGQSTASVFLPEKPAKSVLQAFRRQLLELHGSADLTLRRLPPQDWAESWKRHFKPIDIRGRLLVRPSWSKRRPRKGQAVVVLDPGLSFGTGQHATTRFCLEQIVAHRRPELRQSFLDIGSGSGILAIAAAKLAYAPVRAFDIDPEAVRIARQNARRNRVDHRLRIKSYDVATLKIPQHGHDVVCANLIYDVLLEHATRIGWQVKPTGKLVLAGILRTQFKAVARRYERIGFRCIQTESEGEWQSGAFVRKTKQLTY